MLDRIWDVFAHFIEKTFLPLVCLYHAICANPFLNISVESASGFEKAGNFLLTPFQYLFAGKKATFNEDGSFTLSQRFDYSKNLAIKTVGCAAALPASLAIGTPVKALSYLGKSAKKNHAQLIAQLESTSQNPNREFYEKIGLEATASSMKLISQGHKRRPGDENNLKEAKEALKEVAKVLNEANIPWWVDCGTLLGTLRYGGVIPWDEDVDVALLLPDFENARRAFNKLDKNKYIVQNWSGRDFDNTLMKIYLPKSKDFIDIYFYDIDSERKECTYIFSLDQNICFPEWFKIRERRFTKPIAFENLFPLKKADFDGIEVFVPNNTVGFLQRYYGENLDPAKVYNPDTDRFEKDLNHPYWKNAYVH